MGKRNKKRNSDTLETKEKKRVYSEESDKDSEYDLRTDCNNESDAEEVPKKKIKKNHTSADVETPKGSGKSEKSKRQIKKEKLIQRQMEAQMASKEQLKSQCISYLSQWKHDKQNWKFMKVKQAWLYKNKFSSYQVPDSSWPVLLEYFDSAKGNIRNLLLEDANKVIKQMDDWVESQGSKNIEKSEDNEESSLSKPDETSYKRARDLIQHLQE